MWDVVSPRFRFLLADRRGFDSFPQDPMDQHHLHLPRDNMLLAFRQGGFCMSAKPNMTVDDVAANEATRRRRYLPSDDITH